MSSSFYSARRRRNAMWMGLSFAAAVVGLTGLFLILVVLFWKGVRRVVAGSLHADDAATGQ